MFKTKAKDLEDEIETLKQQLDREKKKSKKSITNDDESDE